MGRGPRGDLGKGSSSKLHGPGLETECPRAAGEGFHVLSSWLCHPYWLLLALSAQRCHRPLHRCQLHCCAGDRFHRHILDTSSFASPPSPGSTCCWGVAVTLG